MPSRQVERSLSKPLKPLELPGAKQLRGPGLPLEVSSLGFLRGSSPDQVDACLHSPDATTIDTVRAALAVGGKLVVDSVPDPRPGEEQVLVSCRANGICGSDLRLIEATGGAGAEGMSVVLGHELCGEVLDYGTGVGADVPE